MSQEKDDGGLVLDIEKDPYKHVIKMLFGRWKPYLLRAMDFEEAGFSSFAQFTRQLPISQKVLAQNLKELERDDLISRTVIPDKPPRVQYRLTQRGRSLIPLLDEVYKWGWHDMRARGLSIDSLGEMWHGYKKRDDKLMLHPYKNRK